MHKYAVGGINLLHIIHEIFLERVNMILEFYVGYQIVHGIFKFSS